jgi:hypothetical protein
VDDTDRDFLATMAAAKSAIAAEGLWSEYRTVEFSRFRALVVFFAFARNVGPPGNINGFWHLEWKLIWFRAVDDKANTHGSAALIDTEPRRVVDLDLRAGLTHLTLVDLLPSLDALRPSDRVRLYAARQWFIIKRSALPDLMASWTLYRPNTRSYGH